MTPTMKLRFVERGWRNAGPFVAGGPANREPVYVLQQWWEELVKIQGFDCPEKYETIGEWRDVPLERTL